MRLNKTKLLSGISAFAIAATVSGYVYAADMVEEAVVPMPEAAPATEAWLSVEGRFNMFAGSPFELYGYLDPGPDTGWGGSVAMGFKPGGMDYDFVGRFTYLRSEGDASYSDPYVYPYPESSTSVEQTLMMADFEVGRDIGVGTRVHAGLRFAHYDATQDGEYYGYGYGYFTEDHTFTGIGPRIGIDHRMGLRDNLSLDMSGAVAALYGKRHADIAGYSYYGGPLFDGIDENVWVFNAEASVGLTYTRGNAEFTAGYRVDYLQNLTVHYFDGEGDYLSHGPFLRAKFKFGG